jgi:hypothetical protein
MLIGKIKIKDFINCGLPCQKLLKKELDSNTSWWIGKIAKTADNEITIYNNVIKEKMETLKKQYIKLDDKGNVVKENDKIVFLEDMTEDKYIENMEKIRLELLDIEVDFENIEKIPLSKITCNVSGEDMINLSFMIDENN